MSSEILFVVFALIAFLLFVAEVFVPGGVIGAVGLVSLLTACGFAIDAFGASTGIGVSVFLILITVGGFLVWLMKMPETRIGRKFAEQSGQISGKSTENHPERVGQQGVAETDLRPSGFARIEGERLDVVAARGFVDKGTAVEITEVHGARIVVRPLEDTAGEG